MHETAWISTHLFFTYLSNTLRSYRNEQVFNIADVGSLDYVGTMKDSIKFSTFHRDFVYNYVGLDHESGPNVDIVHGSDWPLQNEEYDIIISSSCFEHDDFFWITFLRLANSLKPGGFIYLNLPSTAPVHRFPVDNWRFYPDSAQALLKWAQHNGILLHLLHSSTLPSNSSESTFRAGDINMIFWKEGELFAGVSSRIETAPLNVLLEQFSTFNYDLLLRLQRHFNHVHGTDISSFLYSQLNTTDLTELRIREQQIYGKESSLQSRYDYQFHPKLSTRLCILLLKINNRLNFFKYHSKGYPTKYQNSTEKYVYNFVSNTGCYVIPLLIPVALRNDAFARRELARSASRELLFQYHDTSYEAILKAIESLLCQGQQVVCS